MSGFRPDDAVLGRGPFDGVRVVELGETPAAAYCCRLLADFGADVVKVEPPHGDPLRRLPPFAADAPDGENSGMHLYLNANKRSVVIDPQTGAGIVRRLVSTADIVVSDFSLETEAMWSVDPEDLRADNLNLLVVTISPFGRTSGYAEWVATDLILEAMGGWVFGLGEADREPIRPPGYQPSMIGGLWAAIAATSAYQAIASSGIGDHVDVAIVEAIVLFQMNVTTSYEYSGFVYRRQGGGSDVNYPQGIYPCKDGLIGINVLYYVEWDRFTDFMGHPEWKDDPRLETPLLRAQNREVIASVLEPWLAERTADEIYRAGQEFKLPFARVNSPHDLLASTQLEARNYWTSYDHPSQAEIQMPGPPFKMTASRWEIRRPAPRLGADTLEVLARAGIPEEVIAEVSGIWEER